MITFEDCYKANMTAGQAARHLGKSSAAAVKWAARRGIKWRAATPLERSMATAKGMADRRKRMAAQINPDRKDKPLPPEQNRAGGGFVLVNHKTGERKYKQTVRACYQTAMILGWTDFDYGPADAV